MTSKPTRLHLLKDNDLLARVSREEIKEISEKESAFGAQSLKLRTVLKILRQADHLAQKTLNKDASTNNQPRETNSATTSQTE